VARENYHATPVNDLKGHGIDAKSFVAGPLEDWTDGALTLDGKAQYASLSHEDMAKPYQYEAGKEKKTAKGKELATPDVDTTSLIIEAYVQVKNPGCVLVAKMSDSGYQLAINKAGGATLTLKAGGAKSEVASGAKLADGKWHHLLAEFDRAANALVIYTDGKKTAEAKSTLAAGASLANDADLFVGRNAQGSYFGGALEFLRITRSSLAESKTSIEELYDWELDGPFLRDFAGKEPTGKGRDAGAFEATGK
jgi:hypothetical protein